MSKTLLVTILFWLPPTVAILFSIIWDTRYWQAREYKLNRIINAIRFDFEPSHRKKISISLKLTLFCVISYFFVDQESLVPVIGMVATYGLWIYNSLNVFENLQQGKFPHASISLRNISIWLISIVGMALIPVFISIPLFLGRFLNFSSYEAYGVIPQATSFGNTLVPDFYMYLIFCSLLAIIFDLATPLTVSLAVLLSKPITWIHEYVVVHKAKNTLALFPDLVVIAITGSKGKSTVRDLIKDILSDDYEVAVTKEDETSLISVAETINSQLKIGTEVLIIELNAFEIGDIRKVKRLITPQLSIITGIDESHIGLFGSKEETLKAKSEILEILPDSGTAILNGDDELVAKLAEKTNKKEIFYFTHHDPHKDFKENRLEVDTFFADNTDTEEDEIIFDLHNQERSLRITAHIHAEYILSSLLAAIATCNELGMSLGKIADRIAHITKATPHFDVLDGDNNTNLIIDSRPANLARLENFVKFAAQLPEGRKLLVTTGIHELGKYKSDVYKRLRRDISNNFDLVITYDPHLLESLRENNTTLELVRIKNRLDLLYELRIRQKEGDSILIVGDVDPWVISELSSEE